MLGSGLGVGNFLSSPDDFVSRPISRPNVVASTPILEGLTGQPGSSRDRSGVVAEHLPGAWASLRRAVRVLRESCLF